ncbi:hypothetical protein B0H14DRAFT_2584674 [Mycena olivaceomarginata]|nr:hypothetical protein B0H14DRAFT_2584674 [Mycena olivaceomarginata]
MSLGGNHACSPTVPDPLVFLPNEVEIAGWLYPRFVRAMCSRVLSSARLESDEALCALRSHLSYPSNAHSPALHAYEVGQQRGGWQVLDRPMEKSRWWWCA